MKSRATIYRHLKKVSKNVTDSPGKPIQRIVSNAVKQTLEWVLLKKAPEPADILVDAQIDDNYLTELLNAITAGPTKE